MALATVTAVWLLSAWWSFAEQTRAADTEGFAHPAVLPWMLDGLAFALALVALAATLDNRTAVAARLGALVALTASAYVNVRGVVIRTDGAASLDALTLAAIAPVAAFLAFDVILSGIRRQVRRWRGLPAPVPLPSLRPIRVALSPVRTLAAWRTVVLELTDPARNTATSSTSSTSSAPAGTADVRSLFLEPEPEPACRWCAGYADGPLCTCRTGCGGMDCPAAEPGRDWSDSAAELDAELVELLEPPGPGSVPAVTATVHTRVTPGPDAAKKVHILAALDDSDGDVPDALQLLAEREVTTAREYVYRLRREQWTPAAGAAVDAPEPEL